MTMVVAAGGGGGEWWRVDELSTDKQKVSTNKKEVSTDRPDEGTNKQKVSTDKEEVSTDRPDEGTIDQTERRSATPTTPTPTPTIFELMKTICSRFFNMSQATKAVSRDKERKDSRRFLAEQRAAAIRNRPPTRTQLRSQMMTYLKHVGNKKHSDLKNKTFEEIQALYEKVKRFDESFTVIGSTKDERKIKEMNEGASDPDKKKKFVKEDVLTKVPAKPDVAEQGTKKRKGGHMKMLARKRKRPQPDVDSDDEHRKLNKVSSPDGDYLVIYRANGNFRAFNYLLEILKDNDESSTKENDQVDFWGTITKLGDWQMEIYMKLMLEFNIRAEDGTSHHIRIAKDVKETLRSDQYILHEVQRIYTEET
ncbi:hypothetical protein Tco_1131369 [Tanacetum coccineum]